MNLVLLSETEAASGVLPAGDARAAHLLKVVGVKAGGSFFVGVANGARGKATILDTNAGIRFSVDWETAVQEKLPLVFVVGLPRPQTAKKVLFELTALGAAGIHFFKSEKGDPAYATATLWRDEEWRDEVARGAEQAFSTLLPEVVVHASLIEAFVAARELLPHNHARIAPDVYGAKSGLELHHVAKPGVLIAIGPERGWSDREREVLGETGFTRVSMGDRVLRVETACVAAGAVALSGMGCWQMHRS